jgi:hypothetical protein
MCEPASERSEFSKSLLSARAFFRCAQTHDSACESARRKKQHGSSSCEYTNDE